ncbi:glycosyltransferase [Paludibaculum fermentans]|uniref:glycosyltransferase n=1 Tax=Paludibaculum fermentans TaxID=1473598 RepID=UPI003EBD5916
MRILLAHSFYRARGGEDVVFEAETALLRQHGHSVFCLTRQNKDFEILGVTGQLSSMIWNQGIYQQTKQLVRDHQIELVHVHNTFPSMSPSIIRAACSEGASVVQTLHNYRIFCPAATFLRNGAKCDECLGSTLMWPAVRHGCYRHSSAASAAVAAVYSTHRAMGTWTRHVDRFIALSDWMKERVVTAGLPEPKVAVKHHFVENPHPVLDRPRKGALFVGRLTEEKGLRTLLSAWSLLEAPPPLTIVGEGPLGSEFQSSLSQRGEIRWMGQLSRSKILQLMEEAECLIVPSILEEPFGLVVIEAYSAGLPVIASRVGTLPELLVGEQTGFLCQPGDPHQLAAAVLRMFADSTPRHRLREQARATYETSYQPEANHQLLMKIYQNAKQDRHARKQPE